MQTQSSTTPAACPHCGDPIISRWRTRQVTCGKPACQRERERQVERERRNALKAPVELKKCARVECGTQFVPSNRNSRINYCSPKCRYTDWRRKQRKELTCANCGKSFMPEGFRVRRKYCSEKCMRTAVRQDQSDKRHKASAAKWVPRKCAYSRCRKLFNPKGTPWNNYCSSICRRRAAHQRAEIPTARRLAAKYGLQIVEIGKIGRPRKDDTRGKVLRLRAAGKSWNQVAMLVKLSVGACRGYAKKSG